MFKEGQRVRYTGRNTDFLKKGEIQKIQSPGGNRSQITTNTGFTGVSNNDLEAIENKGK